MEQTTHINRTGADPDSPYWWLPIAAFHASSPTDFKRRVKNHIQDLIDALPNDTLDLIEDVKTWDDVDRVSALGKIVEGERR